METHIASTENINCFFLFMIPAKIIQHLSMVKQTNATGMRDVAAKAKTPVQKRI